MLYSRLSSFLTVVVLVLVLGMFFYTQKGLILFIPFSAVAVTALILWMSYNLKIHPDKVMISFILAIMGLIFLNMFRYLAGFASIGSTLFNAVFLFGGYCLIKRAPIGSYMAWFVFIWSIFQGFLQFYMAYALKANYLNYYCQGIIAGILVLILGVSGIYFIFKQSIISTTDVITPNKSSINLWTAFSLNIAVLYSIVILSSQPRPTPDLILLWISLIIGIVLWQKTTAFKPANVHKILPLYMLMLALYILYTQETEVGQYEEHIALLFKINLPYPELYFIKLILMLFGAISLYRKKPIGNLIVLVACIDIILTQPIAFFLFPLLESIKNNYPFHYFPGMWTALLPVIPAVSIIVMIIQGYLPKTVAGKLQKVDPV